MSESKSSSGKSSDKSSSSKAKDGGTPKAKDSGSGDSSGATASDSGGEAGKSAKDSIGGASDIHYGFFSSVRTPEYRSGWDDIWSNEDGGRSRAKRATTKATSRSGPKAGPKPKTVELDIGDLPADIRDELVEAARKKMRRTRASYDKLEASGSIDWTISVTVNGGRG
jgi:hypothetical protein